MNCQLPLFDLNDPPSTEHDPIQLLRQGAALVLSVSGGKDSDAMSHFLLDRRTEEGWPGEAVMVHADLGRAEWFNTPNMYATWRGGKAFHCTLCVGRMGT